MILFFRHLHRIYVLLVILLFFVLFYPFYRVAASKPESYDRLNRLRVLNSRLCSLFGGLFFRFHYAAGPLPAGQYIYCGNHTSNLDIMIFCILAKERFCFMGKNELLKNPVLKLFFETIDIHVNRDSRISAFRAFKLAAERLKDGMSLIIFPEGKIDDDHYPPVLGEFKNGPFRLAIDAKIPIVPVKADNVWKLMWDTGAKYGTRPGSCDIYVYAPVYTENLVPDDAEQLKQTIFDLIQTNPLKNEHRQRNNS